MINILYKSARFFQKSKLDLLPRIKSDRKQQIPYKIARKINDNIRNAHQKLSNKSESYTKKPDIVYARGITLSHRNRRNVSFAKVTFFWSVNQVGQNRKETQ